MNSKQFVFICLLLLGFSPILIAGNRQSNARLKQDSIRFYNAQDFTIVGKFHNEKNYNRFPANYQSKLRKEVWELGLNSAGIAIRFRSNAREIQIKWMLKNDAVLPHMASTGVKGLDLYALEEGRWRYIQTGRPKAKTSEYVMLRQGLPVYREYVLNLPLYDGVDSLSIGVNLDAEISKPLGQQLIDKKPVVYYGSSIAQGGCASRPGMAFTNIISRKLGRAVINMGFSGNGTFDSSVAEAMIETDAALYVVDCNPNTQTALIYKRALQFVTQLTNARPGIPVLMVENFLYESSFFIPTSRADNVRKRYELRKAYATLLKNGIKNCYYQKSDGMIGYDHEGTVDGVHPNDVGMLRIADFLFPVIKKLVKD